VKFSFVFLLLVLSFELCAQNAFPYGKINVRHYSQKDYAANLQSWDVIQDNDYFVYFANNGGVLEFNGETWATVEMQTTPRAFAKNDSGRIFVGAMQEFGFLDHDELGKTIYSKISAPVDSLNFQNIWQVYCFGEHTYFVAAEYVFIYHDGKIDIINIPNSEYVNTSMCLDETLIITCEQGSESRNQIGTTSYVLQGEKFIPIDSSQGIKPKEVFIEDGKKYIIDNHGKFYEFQQNGSYYKFIDVENRSLNIGDGYRINDITKKDQLLVVGTAGNGVMIFTTEGKLVRTFKEKDGLENLEIHKVYFDQYDNLWVCNDNGIDFIETSSAITSFDQDFGIISPTEDIQINGDQLLIGNHTDLFERVYNESSTTTYDINCREKEKMYFENLDVFGMEIYQFKKFTFSDGSTYNLVVANDGVYSLDDQKEKHLVAEIYAWDMFQSFTEPDRILVGLDGDGLGSILYKNGTLTYEGSYAGTTGAVRSVVEYYGNIYYSVQNEGVHVLDTTKDQSQNLLEGLRVYSDSTSEYQQYTLTIFENKLYVGTPNGLYEVIADKLVESKLCNSLFAEEKLLVHRIFNDNDDRLWLVLFHNAMTPEEYSEIGYVSKAGNSEMWISSPFNELTEDVIQTIKRGKDGIVWFGGSAKIYAYNENHKANFDLCFKTFITKVILNGDSTYLYNTHHSRLTNHTIAFAFNTIQFQFATNSNLAGQNKQYSYFLEGLDTSWSEWASASSAHYQRLAEGDYVFHVKSRNNGQTEGETVLFSFTVLPPWYRSTASYFGYTSIFILFASVITWRLRRRQKLKLETEVNNATSEIREQKNVVEKEKEHIQEAHKEVTDSIAYAKRIQRAILPSERLVKEYLKESFVLYKPKDIVAGDFYWLEILDKNILFAAADCTGHGVPGALVSVICNGALNRSVREFGLSDPGMILDKAREIVIQEFEKSEEEVKDGMDISLCSMSSDLTHLSWAGANNPIWIIRKGSPIVDELKANKQPIGKYSEPKPFTTHTIQLHKGDTIYIFTDGYQDQFGGEKGKKFKPSGLKQLLISIQSESMERQKELIDDTFKNWVGNLEQIDDVCIIGVRI